MATCQGNIDGKYRQMWNSQGLISENSHSVVLIHGIWTRGLEMFLLKRRLEKRGFSCSIYSYPALMKSFNDNISGLKSWIERKGIGVVSLVGHSYGGLLACGLLRQKLVEGVETDFEVNKCVFLGAPLMGSSVVKRLYGNPLLKLLTGKSLIPLKQGCSLPIQQMESIMVAGTLNIGFGMFFIEKGDGMVALSDTEAPWIEHHYRLKTTHLGLVLSRKTADIVVNFLSQTP